MSSKADASSLRTDGEVMKLACHPSGDRSSHGEEDVGAPLRLVRLGAGVCDVDFPGRARGLQALRAHPLHQRRLGLPEGVIRSHMGDRSNGTRGKLAGLDSTHTLHRRGYRHPALEVDRVAVHRMVDRERHAGRLPPALLDAPVHLSESGPITSPILSMVAVVRMLRIA